MLTQSIRRAARSMITAPTGTGIRIAPCNFHQASSARSLASSRMYHIEVGSLAKSP